MTSGLRRKPFSVISVCSPRTRRTCRHAWPADGGPESAVVTI